MFVHRTALQQAEIATLHEGDILICDVALSPKGKLQAIAVHSVQKQSTKTTMAVSQQVIGVVDFFNTRKGYGFVKSAELPEDVYVSARTLEESGVEVLEAGSRVRVSVEPGRFGKGYMATSLDMLDAGIG